MSESLNYSLNWLKKRIKLTMMMFTVLKCNILEQLHSVLLLW